LLSLPKIAAINTHGSLLPKYRGITPLMWAIAHGDENAGLTIHHMVDGFDAGRIIRQELLKIGSYRSFMALDVDASLVLGRLIVDSIDDLSRNPHAGVEQEGASSYFSCATRECVDEVVRRRFPLWRLVDVLLPFRNTVNETPLP
jgi:methionyl-tRNA formyltransferase